VPIHLPAISRRRFLARSITAGAALALGPSLRAAAKPEDPNLWALLSDTHLAADRAQIGRGINMADHFEAVSRELLSLEKRPTGVVINGDCAFNSGLGADYEFIREELKPLREAGMPIHLSLGNHDNRERFWEAFETEKSAKRPLADKQASLLKTPRANWFILDSLETTLATPGLLGKEQLDWLAATLDANADKPALVMIHHNPGISGNLGLKDTMLLYEIIRPRRQVKAYIFGHTHAWSVTQDSSGIHLINLPPVSYLFQEGQPAGWVKASLEKSALHLELLCIDRAHPSHGQKHKLEYRA
jgi:hypothetical protein